MRMSTCHPDRKHFCKGFCMSCYNTAKEHDPERQRAKCHPDRVHRGHGLCKACHALFWRHGLTPEEIAGLLAIQRCEICGKAFTPGRAPASRTIDHDHVTGKVRGTICRGCNLGIGHFLDSPENLRKAANYLERST